jgi:hypothetical protein
MNRFKVGDSVVCVDNNIDNLNIGLEFNKVYKVVRVSFLLSQIIFFDNLICGYYEGMFITLNESRRLKLDKLKKMEVI